MYYVEKVGVYGHGVFWIGEDLNEARKACDTLCSNDIDGHHDWIVYKYESLAEHKDAAEYDAEHEEVYKRNKGDEKQ